ncbi:hypothetical protein LF817_05540 [Halobacillus sp. A1]|nr:hypothetical protein [Halobacillus sp. A1]MCP3030800.1 hypothetical protein [Halobacillus sp. A1]
MKWMFILSAASAPLFSLVDKGATGILLSLMFLFLAAFFSKPRLSNKDKF